MNTSTRNRLPVALLSFILVSLLSITIATYSLASTLGYYRWLRDSVRHTCSHTWLREPCALSLAYADSIVMLVVVGIVAALLLSLVVLLAENLTER